MAGEVILIHRVKQLDGRDAPARLLAVEKWPDKALELRHAPPRSRYAGRETDVTVALRAAKVLYRVKRAPKLRFFRGFKLLERAQRVAVGRELELRPAARVPKFP